MKTFTQWLEAWENPIVDRAVNILIPYIDKHDVDTIDNNINSYLDGQKPGGKPLSPEIRQQIINILLRYMGNSQAQMGMQSMGANQTAARQQIRHGV